ncbi:hypothetical protein A3A76_03340 [Candidatus Woesebacteria bacterium RIFCSPLOWO2_01_FULL_39_23]|uniref:Glycosyltransferase 2-like domain-containing protein n=1 Tax=Candidatus Woesebacteria bacterium RIFCSPHIGHO2_01_FULL_40_22 TaxID=1802499 RepID=A0A1F7YJG4_9BACT|nr:MAG: hypothetical protein A2141_00685 [Candidatus Woesebacteria bacterium RBG_16_40_11]OGM27491.1 MAG: hypothetical protein A2628_01740 [Candidatus Woesebacteria bacterium RIFCSPHIGHO2_01_FULL_40_22]OGM36552.1 MAG: hypothetical protein A3E41_03905 [Candidatus Woesebacteria bacterium RIFCSPHIGHO2_12_FULL_38_9]OGM62665.1 MAG: hypothetical protein A3A76_03340 [Candidatus Woesebacteria bacterium RIFCSPLOWO2_01_FULL_39_23]
MNKPQISVLIVNYNTNSELISCIKSLEKSIRAIKYEIIIVDNSVNKDLGRYKNKHVKYVKSRKNLGYGAGNNLAAKYAKGDFLLILNPDTLVLPGTLNKLCEPLIKNKEIAIVAPKIIDTNAKVIYQTGYGKLTPLTAIFALTFIAKILPDNKYARAYWLKENINGKLKEAFTIPGSAFLIRQSVFEEVRGFDENMFLYFEEQDLCKRVRDAGYKIYLNQQAKIIHFWDNNKGNEKLMTYFRKSRFYYFRKHFGLIQAGIVELFARFSKYSALILALTLVGLLLRVYKLSSVFPFTSEVGDNLLEIKNLVLYRTIPLIGPPTSHPWLRFGPLFYWIYTPILLITKFNPLSYAYFGAFISALIIPLNYSVIAKLFDKYVATISSLLIVISPLYLRFSLEARFFNIVALLIYPYIFLLYKIIEGEKKYLFWLFFTLGIMFSFHYTPLFLIPVTIFLIYVKKVSSHPSTTLRMILSLSKYRLKDFYSSIIGMLLPLTPLLIYDAKGGFRMVKNLLLWIPFRLLGFAGLYPKNNLSPSSFMNSANSLNEFLFLSFLPKQTPIAFVFVISIVLYVVIKVLLILIHKRITNSDLVMLAIFNFGIVALFLHGEAPVHYYLPIFPLPIVLFSLLLINVYKSNLSGKLLVTLVLGLLAIININFLITDRNHKSQQNFISEEPYFVPYSLQTDAVKYISDDVHGAAFSLKRRGIYDYFDYDFARNYQYLLWLEGNEPQANAKIIYTIYEGGNYFPNNFGNIVYQKGGLLVGK